MTCTEGEGLKISTIMEMQTKGEGEGLNLKSRNLCQRNKWMALKQRFQQISEYLLIRMTVCVNRYPFIQITFPHKQIQPAFDPEAHFILNFKRDQCQKALKSHHPLVEQNKKFALQALRLSPCLTSTKIEDFLPLLHKHLFCTCSSECIGISECHREQMSKIRISKSSSSVGSSTLKIMQYYRWVHVVLYDISYYSCLGSRLERLRGTRAIPRPTAREFPA